MCTDSLYRLSFCSINQSQFFCISYRSFRCESAIQQHFTRSPITRVKSNTPQLLLNKISNQHPFLVNLPSPFLLQPHQSTLIESHFPQLFNKPPWTEPIIRREMPEECRGDTNLRSIRREGTLFTRVENGDSRRGADDFVVASEDESVRQVFELLRCLDE